MGGKMNKRFFKRITSIMLCVIMFFCINASHVNAADIKSQNQRLLQKVNDKINTAVEQNIAPEDIIVNLSDSDIEILKNSYSAVSESENLNYGFSKDVLNNPEVEIIDNLAKEYYEYYTAYGEFPNSDSLINNSQNITPSLITPAYSYAGDYSELMKGLGYTFTVDQIARQLVSIGTYINIGSAFPFLDLVALIAGMGLITFTAIVIAYSAVAVGANNLILTWYVNSASDLLNARTTTAAVVVQKQQGAKYWSAYLVDYKGLGGIRVAEPITIDKAITKVLANNSYAGVFTYEINIATHLAQQASPIYGYKKDPAHNSGKQIYNLPHVHIRMNASGTPGLTHIWYLGI
ncbi:hypothetical protein QA584_03520 [Anaerocolumna sp. AGMB13025]|uniref:hypothetical protein n=1 Tax=Anaerocolumna sp. AGMB13025 TaxID=3039116 RepID=UPI00241EA3D1|nr:hypothetical protein [Anaerocolumna sp. AGMB13025]WFR58145.1 hypothetical protein QA584_03520 [Anaerocolumna sp. AGMB13025]